MKIYAARNLVNQSDKVRLHAEPPFPISRLPKDYYSTSGSFMDECSVRVFQILTGRMIEPGEVIELEIDT